jgi:polyferredoxin/Na+-translocating ferredoxin:NAD+ oxidoreductase RNF subunit RnfB
MKKLNWLKWLRVVLACLVVIPVLLVFVDFFHLLPHRADVLLHLQLVPALLAGMWGIVLFLFLLTLIFGRLYCSVICPAGVFQDVFNRISSRGRKRNKHKRYFHYTKPNNWLRYTILAISVLAFVAGSSALVILLDPYSNMGRVMNDLVRPALIPLNNMLAGSASGSHALHTVTPSDMSVVSIVVAGLFLVTIAVMSVMRGRLYCNTICPAGTLLGLISRFSFVRIAVDKQACNHCGVCARSCKSQCIDSKNSRVDTSRCVTCFNCIDHCSQDALSYKLRNPFAKNVSEAAHVPAKDSGRRSFLIAGATAMAAAPVAMAQNKLGVEKRMPIMPPGAGTRSHFNEHCTACHVCVAQCPATVLRPTAFGYGIMGMMQPEMSFGKGFCQPDCTRCSNVCPTGALSPLTKEEKHVTQVGIAHFTQTRCVVYLEETDCGACSEHCPTQAVSMVDYKNGLRIPHVSPEICIGCGGCQYVCPAEPKAIVVHANKDQQKARSIPKESAKEHKIDNFGF